MGGAGIEGTDSTGAAGIDESLTLWSGVETVMDAGGRWLDAASCRGVESTGAEGGSGADCLLSALDFAGTAFDAEPALVKNVTSTCMFANNWLV